MDRIVFFHYQHRNTIIHNLDNRIKIFIMIMLSLSINLINNIYGYMLIFIYVLVALILSNIAILSLLKNLKMFMLLIAIIIISGSLKISIVREEVYMPTIEFVQSGFITSTYFVFKIILIVTLTTVITSTISLISFRNTIEWYLSLFPFIQAKRIATIINMIFIFIPTIFDKYIEIKNAQISRCIDNRKNPIKKILFVSIALLNSILRKSDEIAYAMESRNYSENSSKVIFDKPKKIDILLLLLSIFISVASILIP